MDPPLWPLCFKSLLTIFVVVPAHYLGSKRLGTVIGVATCHVIFTYIVLLDEPVKSSYGVCRAITVTGPELNSPDGKHWRLESPPEVQTPRGLNTGT